MGIHLLNNFLRNHIPNVYRDVCISQYSGKRLAIDINLYLYQFKSTYKDSWMNGLLKLINGFVVHGIQFIFIFDTKAPIEKDNKKFERWARKHDAELRINEIYQALERFEETGEILDILLEITRKRVKTRLLQLHEIREIDRQSIETELRILRNQTINITKDDIYCTKRLLQLLGIPYLDSPTEAETLCSYLCIHGLVDAVLSNDTDVLVYGTPIFVTRLKNGWCTELRINDILESLQWTLEQFRDFSIMSGTDYNSNIPGVGIETSFKLIKEHGSIEEIQSAHPDWDMMGILKYDRVRTIFDVSDVDPRFRDITLRREVPQYKEALIFAHENRCQDGVEDYFRKVRIIDEGISGKPYGSY